MVFFTTPDLLEIGKLPFVTPYEKPTRHEALRYYRRVVDAYRMNIAFGEEALAIEKEVVEGETVFVVDCRSIEVSGADASPCGGVRDRLLRSSEHPRDSRRRSAARPPLLRRSAHSLPAERSRGGRQEFGGDRLAGALSGREPR